MDTEEAKIYSGVVISAVVLASVFIYFFVSIVRQQRRIVQLQKENNSAEITALEKERSRIARDLHDDLSHDLITLKHRVWNFASVSTFDREYIEFALNKVIDRMREISFDLMPDSLIEKGLFEGLRQFILRLNETYSIGIGLTVDVTIEIPDQKAIHIFRIVQEAIHNAVKHSQATEMLIVFDKEDDLFTLKIADDGIGMDFDQKLKKSSGFGLRSIQNRVDILEGNMFAESQKGKGLSYVFEFPISNLIAD